MKFWCWLFIDIIVWLGAFPQLGWAAPVPTVSISANANPKRSEDIVLTLTIDNTGDQIGYFPYIRLILPSQLSNATNEDSCGGIGSPQITTMTANPSTDPYIGESIALGGSTKVVFVVPPVAELAPSQPAISCKIRFNATAAAGFSVTGVRAIFAYGNSVNGQARSCGSTGATLCSGTTSTTINPKYAFVTTSASAPSAAGTGPQYPITVSLNVDVAAGQTLTSVTLSDVLPDAFVISDPGNCSQVTVNPAPSSCSFTPNVTSANGGTLQITYASLNTDATVTYVGYIRRLNDAGTAIIDPATGAKTASQNSVTLNSTQTGSVSPITPATFDQRSIQVVKSVAVVSEFAGGKAGYSPGDTIEWTYTMAISDYFQFENVVIADTLQDGQSFVNNSLAVTVAENTANTVLTEAALEGGGYLTITPGAITPISLNLGAAMADIAFGFADDVLSGANSFGAANRATKVTIVYRTTINENFSGAGGSVDSGDLIGDVVSSVTTNIVGQAGNYNFGAELPLTTSATIVPVPGYAKALTHINGSAVGAPPLHIAAGDLAVFRLRITVPDGGGESFRIEDYLPGPIFRPPGGCFTYAAVAANALANGQWTFGTNQLALVSGDVTPTCDFTNDKVQFDLADFDIAAGTSDRIFEIYFAVAASTDPSQNGFEFANSSFFSFQNSGGSTVDTLLGAATFLSDTPNIVLNFHSITATDDANGTITSGNLTGIDAGALQTFQTSVTNNGTGPAQDGILTIPLPTGYEAPSNPTLCTETGGSDCQYTITDNGQCGGALVVTASDQTQILASNVDVAQGATCIITYQARIALAAAPAQLMTEEASFTWDNGGTTFSPKFDQVTTTLKSPSLSVTSVTAPAQPKPGDDIDMRVTITAPDGTTNGFFVDIVDSSFVTFDEASNATISMTIFAQTISATNYYCMINAATLTNNICFTNDPRDAANLTLVGGNLRINFGQMINGYAGSTDQSVVFDVLNGIIDTGATSGAKTLRADYYWQNPNGAGNLSVSSANAGLTVYTPKLTVSKCATTVTSTAEPISMGETVSYSILVKNTGLSLSTAYDLGNLVDTLTSGITYSAGTLSAYYCTSGASTKSCTSWAPGAAGCTVVAPAPAGNLTIPILNDSGQPDIAPDAYFHVTFTADVNCEIVADNTGLDLVASHPDNDGINNACTDPVLAFANTLSNVATGMAYSSQDGAGPNGVEGSYTAANSATVSLNLDSDNDGILNSLEGSADADGDGVPNYLDTDSDDNGIADSSEASNASAPIDTDSDGIPDFKDLDNDGDGISDSQEITDVGGAGVDTDGDGKANYLDADSDNDGVSDFADGHTVNTDGAADGYNAFDLDSDNDGIPDLIENGLGACDDGTGTGNPNDGILHPNELATCSASVCAGALCDANGNGGVEADEFVGAVLPDQDADGIPNYRDLDSDNDGLPDFYENLFGALTPGSIATLDANGNGFFEGTTVPGPIAGELRNLGDLVGNANGVIDQTDALDSDGDGAPNFLDSDSDNDGVPDIVENARYFYDTNGNNRIAYGAGQEYDSVADTNLIGPADRALIDTDGDGIYNYMDRDSDGDGIGDWIEAWNSNIDTNADGAVSAAEFAVAVVGAGNNDAYFTSAEYQDTDSDGLPDIFDLDSDGDTIKDEHESDSVDSDPATTVLLWSSVSNSEGAGPPDFRDTDSDGDGYSDTVEAGDGNLATAPVDTDADGLRDFQDLDSDGDGLTDANETAVGTSRANPDSDGDACKDGCEIYGNAYAGPGVCSYNGKPWSFVGTLLAPVTDPLDADTDDGGTSDCAESSAAGNPNPRAGQGADDPYQSDDPDGDGLSNAQEITAGTDLNNADSDGDGLTDGAEALTHLTDPLDTDTDNGGVPDGTEIGLGKNPLDSTDDDTDGDGLTNNYEISIGLDPTKGNSNADCLDDADEIGPDPANPLDSDGDGAIDALEEDNDGDGVLDCEEVTLSTNPNSNDTRIRGGGGCGLVGPPSSGGPGSTLAMFFSVLILVMGIRFRWRLRPIHIWSIILILVVRDQSAALDSQLFQPQVLQDGTFTLLGTSPLGADRWNLGLTYSYAQNPLLFGQAGSSKNLDNIVNSLHTAHLEVASGFNEKWNFLLGTSYHYLGSYEPASSSESSSVMSPGDLHVGAHYSLWQEPEKRLGLAALLMVSFPTGDKNSQVGEGETKVTGKILSDKKVGESGKLTFNAGYTHQNAQQVYTLKVGSRVNYGIGYSHAISRDRLYEAVTEFFGQTPVGNVAAASENSPIEGLLGLRKYGSAGRWDLGVGRGLTQGYGAPELRAFFSYTWGSGREPYDPATVNEEIVKSSIQKLDVPIQIKVEQIFFATGKSEIRTQSFAVLDRLIALLMKYPEIKKVRIEGHTDNVGDREKNLALSNGRANAVYDYLVNRGNVIPERLEWQGFGPDQPIADNSTSEGQRANRRVDFKILEISGDAAKFDLPNE